MKSPNVQPTIIHASFGALALRLLLIIFLVDSFYAFLFISYLMVRTSTSDYIAILVFWALHTVKFLLLSLLLLREVSRWLSKSYFLLDHHLMVAAGIGAETEEIYELTSMDNIHLHQDWLGKRLNYGEIVLSFTHQRRTDQLILHAIANPHQVMSRLETYLGAQLPREDIG